MPLIKRNRPKPGDPIRAADMDAIWDAIEKLNFEVAPPLARSGGVIYWNRSEDTRPAFVTTAITTRSGSTPGTGTVAFAEWDGTSFTQGTATQAIRNQFVITASIAVGKVVDVRLWRGEWWLKQSEC